MWARHMIRLGHSNGQTALGLFFQNLMLFTSFGSFSTRSKDKQEKILQYAVILLKRSLVRVATFQKLIKKAFIRQCIFSLCACIAACFSFCLLNNIVCLLEAFTILLTLLLIYGELISTAILSPTIFN
uniref:Uncharacterized protein n=1 Tax=Glossina brevipalpis TaxID=37001 RepID=A0A1A9W0C2_9MUSC